MIMEKEMVHGTSYQSFSGCQICSEVSFIVIRHLAIFDALKIDSDLLFASVKPFKNDEKCFLFKKLLSFSRYLNFCLDFLVM